MLFSKFQQANSKNSNKHNRHVFVLSCDGAGVRSYISVQILLVLEDELRMQGSSLNITNCFDMFVGTSMGTLVNVLVQSAQFQTQDIIHILFEELPKVLKEDSNSSGVQVLGKSMFPKYTSNSLDEYLRALFGNRKFSSLSNHTIIPVYDLLNLEPYEFSSKSTTSVPLYKVLKAALALPRFFAPVFFSANELSTNIDGKMIDGSIYSANPSLHALAHIETDNTIVHVLSVGAGIVPVSNRSKNAFSGLIDSSLGLPSLQLIQNSRLQVMEFLLSRLDRVEFTSINSYLSSYTNYTIYDWSDEHIEHLRTSAINTAHNNRLSIKKFAQQIINYKNG